MQSVITSSSASVSDHEIILTGECRHKCYCSSCGGCSPGLLGLDVSLGSAGSAVGVQQLLCVVRPENDRCEPPLQSTQCSLQCTALRKGYARLAVYVFLDERLAMRTGDFSPLSVA